MERKTTFEEMMFLVAHYDWAVEGGSPEPGQAISREDGKRIREGLIKLTRELEETK